MDDTTPMRPRRRTQAPRRYQGTDTVVGTSPNPGPEPEPHRTQPDDWPEIGGYAVSDPYKPGCISYWVITSAGAAPEPWPRNTDRYGPPPPPRVNPTLTKEQRRAAREAWKAAVADYRRRVLELILADPGGARALFTALTDRCGRCVGHGPAPQISVTNLPVTAAWERPEYRPQAAEAPRNTKENDDG